MKLLLIPVAAMAVTAAACTAFELWSNKTERDADRELAAMRAEAMSILDRAFP